MSYKAPVIGEVRGPFETSWNSKATGGCCFLVYGPNGWQPFTGPWSEERRLQKEAAACGAELMAAKTLGPPCPHCGREESGAWFTPCPDYDCPSQPLD